MSILFSPALYIAVGVAASIGSVLLFRRFGGVGSVLLIIGAFLYTLTTVSEACITSAWLWRHVVLAGIIDDAMRLATVCFTVGFVWFAVRASRTI